MRNGTNGKMVQDKPGKEEVSFEEEEK